MNNIIGKIVKMTILTVASLYAVPVLAQTAPAGSGSTGNFPVITVPPPPMTSVANRPTPGPDSTLWSNGIPGPQNSSVTIPLPAAGGGTGGGGGGGGGLVCAPGQTQSCADNACPPNYTGVVPTSMTCVSPGTWPTTCTPTVAMIDANPTAYGCTPSGGTCTPGTTTVNQTANCPSGYETSSGSTTFTQTATVTTACPGPVTSQGPWTPSASSICAVPGGGPPGCTLAQVNAGTCPTCFRTCGNTESGFATCQTHGITATTCSYWSYSGSSCPAGATGGSWRAGLCP